MADTVYVFVNAMFNSNLFGAQVTATAEVDHEVLSPPWIVDLHRSVRRRVWDLLGRVCVEVSLHLVYAFCTCGLSVPVICILLFGNIWLS